MARTIETLFFMAALVLSTTTAFGMGAAFGMAYTSRTGCAASGVKGLRSMAGGEGGGKTALCILAEGFEEMEAVSPIDLLRRAGVEVTTASLTKDLTVKGRNGISVLADTDLDSVLSEKYDAVVIPGGPPAVPSVGTLKNDARVMTLLREQMDSGGLVSAICAAPSVLAEAGVLKGKKHTAHFSVESVVPEMDKASAVVKDGNLITSQGAGTGTQFGLALVEELVDKKTADEVAASICWKG
eukprot:CAMPEP_0181301648 /NCGR_PEP_ID=MMETSP1101-20121128/7539_1 /TAXON_ID=46948 /ORGANISM="Rhodomonas abbreviata, Strain Caron Lab Isolate" /LENGTH=240 /DNA_ID=CAMNT_0023406973 /DNA_START=43 /DNA_END=765 /DNA_ORIENTATION=+